jgi:hypothetical protein
MEKQFNYERTTDEKLKDIFIPIQKTFQKWQITRDNNVNIWLNQVIGELSWDGMNGINANLLIRKTDRLREYLGELNDILPEKDIEYLQQFVEPLEIVLVELKMAYSEQE